MAIAFVQNKSSGSASTTTLAVTLPAAPANGNLVVVVIVTLTAKTITSVVDTNSVSYVQSPNSPATNANRGADVWMYYKENITGGAAQINVTQSGSPQKMSLFAAEFSGVLTSGSLEIDVVHTGTAAQTNINDPTLTTTNADLLIGGASGSNMTAVSGGWTAIDAIQNSVDWAEYFIQSVSGSKAVGFTQLSATQWAAIGAAFKAAPPPAAGGGGGVPFLGAIPSLGGGVEAGMQQPWQVLDTNLGGF